MTVEDWWDRSNRLRAAMACKPCTHAPKGWRCKMVCAHDGPCPLYPVGWRRFYWMLRLRTWTVR